MIAYNEKYFVLIESSLFSECESTFFEHEFLMPVGLSYFYDRGLLYATFVGYCFSLSVVVSVLVDRAYSKLVVCE